MMTTIVSRSATEKRVCVLFVAKSFDRCMDYVAETIARGWWARVKVDAESALAMAESDPPDVVVTESDITSRFDGFELARRLKSGPTTHRLPVIVLVDPVELPHPTEAPGAVVATRCDPKAVLGAAHGALMIADLLARRRAERDVMGWTAPRTIQRQTALSS
jgi:CheY-like chemotaxis protein